MDYMRRKIWIVGIFLVLAGVLGGILYNRNQGSDVSGKPEWTDSRAHRVPKDDILLPGKSGRVPTSSDRTRLLESLENRWLELAELSDHSGTTPDELALAKETVKRLLCSQEMVRLLEFLNEHSLLTYNDLIDREIVRMFRGDDASEARELLIRLPNKNSSTGTNFREKWSYYAGSSCPDSKFDSFSNDLGDPACVKEAMLGKATDMARVDAEEAMRFALKALMIKTSSYHSAMGLGNVVKEIPRSADFANVEKILSTFEDDGGADSPNDPRARSYAMFNSPLFFGRNELFAKWADVNPMEAANYVVSQSGRLKPSWITTIANVFAMKKPAEALEWVGSLPRGPYYDAAVRGVVPYNSNSTEITEVVSEVQDEKIRAECMKRINPK